LDFYARVAGEAVRSVTGDPCPYFFKRIEKGSRVETPVWYPDPANGVATGEIIASTGDFTGSWTGYGRVDADYYISHDLKRGRLVELFAARQPMVLCSHWQGFYGMHDRDRRGFHALQTVVRRLHRLDPEGAFLRWRKCSEITDYACMRAMAQVRLSDNELFVTVPFRCPELTLRVDARLDGVTVAGKPLRRVGRRADFESGCFLVDGGSTLLAFDPASREVRIAWKPA